ncbi:hypothetical protein ACOKM3_07305 [Streptomyces sp. BH106]|uniref:hypothetical protein n=1 Tax=Streptomyces sp. BH106 TaxID=3410409 RepID=UPI003CF32744
MAGLRDAFETYDVAQNADLTFWNLTDPLLLQALRTAKCAVFELPLDDLSNSRREAKVTGVWMAFIGSNAQPPQFSVQLEHTGDARVRLADAPATVLAVTQPSRLAPQQAVTTPGQEVLGGGATDCFWGRSPTARWRMVLEAEVEQRAGIDLSELLSAVGLAIAFKSIDGK